MHICVGKLTIIWTNAGILLIWPLGMNKINAHIFIEEKSLESVVC